MSKKEPTKKPKTPRGVVLRIAQLKSMPWWLLDGDIQEEWKGLKKKYPAAFALKKRV